MNRDLRIFLLAIGLPAILLALGGLALIGFESGRFGEIRESFGETERAVLASAAEHAAADVRLKIHGDVEPILETIRGLSNETIQKSLRRLVVTSGYVRVVWLSGLPGKRRTRIAGPFSPKSNLRELSDRRVRQPRRPPPDGNDRFDPGERPPPPPPPRLAKPVTLKTAQGCSVDVQLDWDRVLTRIEEMLNTNGVDNVAAPNQFSTIAEVRSGEGDLIWMSSSEPVDPDMFGEAALALPQFPGWKIRVYHRFGSDPFDQALKDRAQEARVRFCLLGGVILILLLCALVAGAVLLLRAARAARREAMLKTDFISNVSHEFKTPLTTICLCAELASGDDLDADERKRAFASVMSEAERLRRLVMNVLDFSRLEKGRKVYEPTIFDVGALAREAAVGMKPRFAEHGLRVAEGSYSVRADRDATDQILLNLLENAAKYAAAGGPVEVSFAEKEGCVEVRVSDRGPGLTPAEMDHVFERFWRADNSMTRETGGNGLGLAISQGLAEGMNGALAVEARAGGGCTFVLTLQAADMAPGTVSA